MDNTSNSNDSSQALEAAGFDLSKMTDEQKQVLSSLSPEEVRTLTAVKERLDAVSDVEAYRMSDTGNLYY